MEDFRNLYWSWYTIRVNSDSLQYFDKTFCENEKDNFYCNLNEIEPDFLSDLDVDSDNESDLTPIDPRTSKRVEDVVIDNSSPINDEKPSIFQNFPVKSTMTKVEHQSCLTALQSLMEKRQVSVQDLIPHKRIREMQLYNEFVMNYSSENPKQNHKLKNMLIERYKQVLEAKAKNILAQPDEFYSLQTAIPFDEKWQAQCNLHFSNAEIIIQEGHVPEFDEEFEFHKILKTCFRLHDQIESNVNYSDSVNEQIDVIIPENALHLLLSSNTISDTWEISVRIYPFDNNRGQLISFDDPLPLRSQSDYIYTQMLEKLVNDEFQASKDTKWFSLIEKQFEKSSNEKTIGTEVRAVDLRSNYKIFEYNDYLKQYATFQPKISNKSNIILCKWSITNQSEKEESHPINLLTRTNAKYVKIENGTPTFVNMSMKLENKTEFGSEVMTKGELIQEWLRQFLLSNGITKRVRIDAHSSKPLLVQNLNLADIESDLFRLDFTKSSDILGSFYSLLAAVNNFPIGDYLFKFNPKYDGKLMVYTKTPKRTPSGISLHELYENVQSKFDLLHKSKYVPIDGNVITAIHKCHVILPCCFPHWIVDRKVIIKKKRKIPQKGSNIEFKKPKCEKIITRKSKSNRSDKSFKLTSTNLNGKRFSKTAPNYFAQPEYSLEVAASSTNTITKSELVNRISSNIPVDTLSAKIKQNQLKPTENKRIYNLRSRNTIQPIICKARMHTQKLGLRTSL